MMVVILTPVDGIIRWLPRGFSCSHRKSPPQGEILIVSARWHGDRFFHHEPDFLGVKDQRFGTPIAQPLSERRLSGAERSVDPDYHCRRPLT